MFSRNLRRVGATAKRSQRWSRRVAKPLALPPSSVHIDARTFSSTPGPCYAENDSWRISSSSQRSRDVTAAAVALRRAVDSRNVSRIRTAYPAFRKSFHAAGAGARSVFEPPSVSSVWSWTRSSEETPSITLGVFIDAIEILTRRSGLHDEARGKKDVLLAADIALDTSIIYGLQTNPTFYSTVVSNLVRIDPSEALSWIRKLEAMEPPMHQFSLDDYVVVSKGFRSAGDPDGMRDILQSIRTHPHLNPSAALWHPYITHFGPPYSNPPQLQHMESALQEMQTVDSLVPSVPLLSDVILSHIRAKDFEGASPHVESLLSILEPESGVNTSSELAYAAAALVRHAGRNGYEAALKEAIELRDAGFRHNSHTMRALVAMEDAPLFDAESLCALAESLDTIVAPEAWAITIRRALKQPNGVKAALDLYDDAKTRDITPSAPMVDPLIHAVLSQSPTPSPDDVDQALDLYYDLRDAHRTSARRKGKMTSRRNVPPDVGVFSSLLRGIARSRQASQTTTDLMMQLLSDMRFFGVRLPEHFIQSVFTELLAVSDSHETAFKIWSYIQDIDPRAITQTGYAAVLEQFAKLSFEDDPLPSIDNYLEIVQSMRNAGVDVNSFVYTTLFTRYASLARSAAESLPADGEADSPEVERALSLRSRILQALRKLHTTLKLDASLSPTTPTMNSLMNAYNHVGAYSEAFLVWEELAYGRPPFDHTSVSIVLDVCGFAGDSEAADRVWRRARGEHLRRDFVPNAANWTALIECRARTGRWESALSTFQTMVRGGGRDNVPVPDAKCAEVTLKFAREHGGRDKVIKMLKEHQPDLYTALVDSEAIEASD